jgi:hypothetical protein
MNAEFELILDECLAQMQAGERIENCLARHPEYAPRLRPLLVSAKTIGAVSTPLAHPAAVRAGREKMLAVVSNKYPSQPVSTSPFSRYIVQIITNLTGKENLDMKLIMRFAIAVMIVTLFIFSTGVTIASANALPGDAFYPAKLTFEDIRLSLTNDPDDRQTLELRYQMARLEEVRHLIQAGRIVEVQFLGRLTDFNQTAWMVSGFTILIDGSTQVVGQPVIGAVVSVHATTQANGTLIGHIMRVLEAPVPMPANNMMPLNSTMPSHTDMPGHKHTHTCTPTMDPTHTCMPTMDPTHTHTMMPTMEPTHTHTMMPTMKPTHTMMPTMKPTMEPIHTPHPGHDKDHDGH